MSDDSPEAFIHRLQPKAKEYNGFNLIVAHGLDIWFYSNHEDRKEKLENGIFGLCNASLDTPWPKVQEIKAGLQAEIKASNPEKENLYNILFNKHQADDDQLPDTGVGKDWEKKLSSIFIESENYGTRCSTILTLDNAGTLYFREKTFPVGGSKPMEVEQNFPDFAQL